MFHFKSSGAFGMKSRQHSSRRRTPAAAHNPCDSTTERSGCSRSSNSLTTPKLPPPPRNAQNNSEFSFSLQRTNEPSAVTTSAPITLSQDIPKRLVSHPVPPPKISPEAPVCETTPAGKTSPASCVAVSIDPNKQPPAAQARRFPESTLTLRNLDKSITSSSQVLKPGRLCPPHRTAVRIPPFDAVFTTLRTSFTSAQRAIKRGDRETMPFQILRASSYPLSPGRSRSPRNSRRSKAWISVIPSVICFNPRNSCDYPRLFSARAWRRDFQ